MCESSLELNTDSPDTPQDFDQQTHSSDLSPGLECSRDSENHSENKYHSDSKYHSDCECARDSEYHNHSDSECRELVATTRSPDRDGQLFPPWLGVFTFALSQVTSAVWTALDSPPCPRPDFREDHGEDDPPGPIRHRNKKVAGSKLQFSPMKLEVHRSPNQHGEQLRAPDDPRLLSPGSERSSIDSFEVIEAPLATELQLMAVYDRNSGLSRGESDSPSDMEPFSVMKNSSADFMDFDFSNLLTSSPSGPQTYCGHQFTRSVMENYHFPESCTGSGEEDGCKCGEAMNCSVRMSVVLESDDGSSSFDILSDPGDEKFALLDEEFTMVDAHQTSA